VGSKLYVVFAIDAEGPAFDPRHPEILSTWDAVDEFLARIFSPDFRTRVTDSEGGWLIISWFIMSWTGFTTNPVRRDFGYHKIYDHYMERWGARMREYRDGVYWHYHHPPPSGVGNEWGKDWSANQEYYNILNRLIIDRGYFPAVFRAGGTIETNESSAWLERWIPFDYSNRAGDLDWDKREGRHLLRDLCDWNRAPADWSPYHPSPEDYQRPGNMKRVIPRCPELLTNHHGLEEADIVMAFERAKCLSEKRYKRHPYAAYTDAWGCVGYVFRIGSKEGKGTILATFDHDYRDRTEIFVERFPEPLARVARRYPTVHWRYASALKAAQSALGYHGLKGPEFAVHFDPAKKAFVITADCPLFGHRPYVVCQYPDSGEYIYEEVQPIAERTWLLPVDETKRARLIGIASSDAFGNVGLKLFFWDGRHLKALTAPGGELWKT